MISTITVAGNSVTLVALPDKPGLRSVEFNFTDAVAIVSSPFTGATQAQQWPGADMWSGTMTLPPLTQAQADAWISALMECRGMANAIQIGDPLKTHPAGAAGGAPVVNASGGAMAIGTTTLYTHGWTPSKFRVLLPGDYVQIGYRFHRNLDVVNTDSSGNAVLSLFPSLREVPTDGEVLILNNPRGLFRLAQNKRTWSSDVTRLTRMSFPILEYR